MLTALVMLVPMAGHAEDPVCGYAYYKPPGSSEQHLLPIERCTYSSCDGIYQGPNWYQDEFFGRFENFTCVRWI